MTQRNNLSSRLLSLFLAMLMIVSMIPATVFAAVTVYNADGTVHGTATDSVESYIARNAVSDLNEAIMKFAASAKVYFS